MIVTRKPTADEFLALRKAAGWHVPDREAVEAMLAGSLFAVCAEEDSRAVGMGRVVGDGALTFYVQDVIVAPDHRRRGLARGIMNAIIEQIHETAKPGAVIGLFSARGLEPFYSQYGFIERPHENLGPGMVQFQK